MRQLRVSRSAGIALGIRARADLRIMLCCCT